MIAPADLFKSLGEVCEYQPDGELIRELSRRQEILLRKGASRIADEAPTPEWKTLRPFRKQQMLMLTPARRVVVVAGRGAGKSAVAKRKQIADCWRGWRRNRHPWFLFILPTLPQAKRVAWHDFIELIDTRWTEKIHVNDGYVEFKTGARLMIAGAERPERIEGNQYQGAIVDERSDQKDELIARSLLPALTEHLGYLWEIGVPKRYGKGAHGFRKIFQKGVRAEALGLPMHDPDYVQSFHWTSADVKTPEQLASLASNMSKTDAQEMLEAMWLDMEGAVWTFNEHTFTEQATYRPDLPVWVSCDFNVDPMSWVFGHVQDRTIWVFDELRMRNTTTAKALQAVKARFATHRAGFVFCGDATSRHRKSSATLTDYAQIEQFDISPKDVRFQLSNPNILDTVKHLNGGFCSVFDEQRVFIHPRCVYLEQDLQSAYYDDKTSEIKYPRSEDGCSGGHLADSLRYFAWHALPVIEQPGEGTIILRTN